jgi:hypothetical protein
MAAWLTDGNALPILTLLAGPTASCDIGVAAGPITVAPVIGALFAIVATVGLTAAKTTAAGIQLRAGISIVAERTGGRLKRA